MTPTRTLCALAAVGAMAWMVVSPATAAPNRVDISPQLVTSGQPTAQELAALRADGFGAVIYLAPPTVPDAVADEARIVAGQGLVFVNLPIAFDAPSADDVGRFHALMQALQPRLAGRRLLVHCQINLRASTLVFLHRVMVGNEDPARAWADVARVWTPSGPWRQLVVQQLAAHGVRFDPF